MSDDNKVLHIIAHTPSENTRRLRDALLAGARHEDIQGVTTRVIPPLEATPETVLEADALILFTTENLAYMSGAMKDFFDRCYYPCLEDAQGKPFALVVRAGQDGTGTLRAMDSIITGLRWKAVQEPLLCRGPFQEDFVGQCEELGMYVAAGLEAGVL